MSRTTPNPDSAAHWALYLLAMHESDNPESPRATAPALWSYSLAKDAFTRRRTLGSALTTLYTDKTITTPEHEYRYVTRDEATQPYAYRITDKGKRCLRRLGAPTEGVGQQTLSTAPPDDLPSAAYDETGHGEPNNRPNIPTNPRHLPDEANPPRRPNRDETPPETDVQPDTTDDPQEYYANVEVPDPPSDQRETVDPAEADPSDGPVERVLVDPAPLQPGQKRHIYVPAGDEGGALIRKCGQDKLVRPRNQLTTVRAGAFEGSGDACKRCLRGVEVKRSPRSLDVDVEELFGEGEDDEQDTPTVSLEPDWQRLASALERAGYPGLATRARQQDLSPAEIYGDILDILYKERV